MEESLGTLPKIQFHTVHEAHAVLEFRRDTSGRAVDAEYLQADLSFERLCRTPRDSLVGHSVSELFPKTELSLVPLYGSLSSSAASVCFEYYSEDLDAFLTAKVFRLDSDRCVLLLNTCGAMLDELQEHRLLREKNCLIQELNHRVKNNLQIVVSLLEFESQAADGLEISWILKNMQSRVYAMAGVHDALFEAVHGLEPQDGIDTGERASVPMARCINDLVAHLARSAGTGSAAMLYCLELDDSIRMPMDTAIPLALIVHELVTNARSHAVKPDGPVSLKISLRMEGDGHCVLVVADDGLQDGAPHKVSGTPAGKKKGIGLHLVEGLSGQLNGSFSVRRDKGYSATIVFPKEGAGEILRPR